MRAGDPGHQLGDLLGLHEALDGGLGQHHLLDDVGLRDAVHLRLVGDLLLHQRGAHVAGVDAVAGHAVLAALESHHLRQPLERVPPACQARIWQYRRSFVHVTGREKTSDHARTGTAAVSDDNAETLRTYERAAALYRERTVRGDAEPDNLVALVAEHENG